MSPQAEDPLLLCDVACGPVVVTGVVSTDVVNAANEGESCAAMVAANGAEISAAFVANEAEVSAATVRELSD